MTARLQDASCLGLQACNSLGRTIQASYSYVLGIEQFVLYVLLRYLKNTVYERLVKRLEGRIGRCKTCNFAVIHVLAFSPCKR